MAARATELLQGLIVAAVEASQSLSHLYESLRERNGAETTLTVVRTETETVVVPASSIDYVPSKAGDPVCAETDTSLGDRFTDLEELEKQLVEQDGLVAGLASDLEEQKNCLRSIEAMIQSPLSAREEPPALSAARQAKENVDRLEARLVQMEGRVVDVILAAEKEVHEERNKRRDAQRLHQRAEMELNMARREAKTLQGELQASQNVGKWYGKQQESSAAANDTANDKKTLAKALALNHILRDELAQSMTENRRLVKAQEDDKRRQRDEDKAGQGADREEVPSNGMNGDIEERNQLMQECEKALLGGRETDYSRLIALERGISETTFEERGTISEPAPDTMPDHVPGRSAGENPMLNQREPRTEDLRTEGKGQGRALIDSIDEVIHRIRQSSRGLTTATTPASTWSPLERINVSAASGPGSSPPQILAREELIRSAQSLRASCRAQKQHYW